MIIGLFTELCTPGGIQLISKHVGCVLARHANKINDQYIFFSLNDSLGKSTFSVSGVQYEFKGFGKNKIKFLLSILKRASSKNLIFIGHPSLTPIALFLKMLKPEIKYLVYSYGIDVWKPLSLLHRYSLKKAEINLSLSSFTSNALINIQKVNPSTIKLLPPALDPVFFNKGNLIPGNSLGVPDGFILLTVARLQLSEGYKGVDTVIRAVSQLYKQFPNLYYVIVGDGDAKKQYEQLAMDLEVSKNVLFVGSKEGIQLLSYFNCCNLFVMPSSSEGFGIVFLEAMAFAKPVIGGNHGGTPDLIKDGENGFLIKHNDLSSLVKIISRFIRDDKLGEQMGKLGVDMVRKKYTLEKFQANLLDILEKLKI